MMDKKSILILCQYFYPDEVSSSVLPTQMAEKFVKDGYKVNVISGWPQEYYEGKDIEKSQIYKGININRIKYSKLNNKSKIGRLINIFTFYFGLLFKIPKMLKNDIVFVYSNPPIMPLLGHWIKKINKNIKLVYVAYDLYPDNAIKINMIKEDGIISKFMTSINKKIYTHADQVIALSEDMKDYMLENYKWLDKDRVSVIPNWYTGNQDIQNKIYNEQFKSLRNEWDLIVLYSGNMGELQDTDTIIESVLKLDKEYSENKKVLFVFTGHGSKLNSMKEKLEKNNIKNYKFYGFLSGTDYTDIINISNICIVTLKEGIEGLGAPSRVYSFLIHNKPILSIMSKDTELARNLKKYNAGYNIKQGDVVGFIDIINELLTNKNSLKENLKSNVSKLHNELYKKEIALNKYSIMTNTLMLEKKK